MGAGVVCVSVPHVSVSLSSISAIPHLKVIASSFTWVPLMAMVTIFQVGARESEILEDLVSQQSGLTWLLLYILASSVVFPTGHPGCLLLSVL